MVREYNNGKPAYLGESKEERQEGLIPVSFKGMT